MRGNVCLVGKFEHVVLYVVGKIAGTHCKSQPRDLESPSSACAIGNGLATIHCVTNLAGIYAQ